MNKNRYNEHMINFITLYQKEILWAIAVCMTLTSYYTYMRDMIRWTTKPHIFSRLIWTLLTWIAFFAWYSDGWWAGTRVLWVSAVFCCVVVFMWAKNWFWYITRSDKIAFTGALLSLPLWYITEDPLLSVILITIIDARSFFPTFRKGYNKPYEETLSMYVLSWLKFVVAFFALEHFSVITILYPASLIVMNFAFVGILHWRRKIV